MNTHIDQLEAWWNNAEARPARKGDTVIWRNQRHLSGTYAYEVGRQDQDEAEAFPDDLRILERAPKPKPAWHDAVAVMAALDRNSYDAYGDTDWPTSRELWVRYDEAWSNDDGITVPPERLIDVTPLVEAKVTDEMVQRARVESRQWEPGGISANAAKSILTAALGLENE